MIRVSSYRPATTQPQLPPPHTMISTSSGTVMIAIDVLLLDGDVVRDLSLLFQQALKSITKLSCARMLLLLSSLGFMEPRSLWEHKYDVG